MPKHAAAIRALPVLPPESRPSLEESVSLSVLKGSRERSARQ